MQKGLVCSKYPPLFPPNQKIPALLELMNHMQSFRFCSTFVPKLLYIENQNRNKQTRCGINLSIVIVNILMRCFKVFNLSKCWDGFFLSGRLDLDKFYTNWSLYLSAQDKFPLWFTMLIVYTLDFPFYLHIYLIDRYFILTLSQQVLIDIQTW